MADGIIPLRDDSESTDERLPLQRVVDVLWMEAGGEFRNDGALGHQLARIDRKHFPKFVDMLIEEVLRTRGAKEDQRG